MAHQSDTRNRKPRLARPCHPDRAPGRGKGRPGESPSGAGALWRGRGRLRHLATGPARTLLARVRLARGCRRPLGGNPKGGVLCPWDLVGGFPESRWGNPCVLPLAERCRRGTEAKSVGKGGMTKVSVVEEMATGTYSGACAVRCGRPQRCIASGRRRRRRRRGGRRWARGCPPCPSGLVRRGPHSPCR